VGWGKKLVAGQGAAGKLADRDRQGAGKGAETGGEAAGDADEGTSDAEELRERFVGHECMVGMHDRGAWLGMHGGKCRFWESGLRISARLESCDGGHGCRS
jgi:hypothetical protein